MPIMTMHEIQSMEDSKFFALATSNILEVELRVSPKERSKMAMAYNLFVDTLDSDLAPSFRPATELSNYDLYCTLRMNDIKVHKPLPTTKLKLEQAHALTSAQILQLTEEKARIQLEIDDETRDVLIQSRQSWVDDMDDDIRDAFDTDMTLYSNWDLYAEHRVNGFPLIERNNQMQMTVPRSQSLSM